MKAGAARGMALGVGLGALPGLAFLGWATWGNPWFLDDPLLFVPLLAGPGAVLGFVLRHRPTHGGAWLGPLAAIVFVAFALRPRPGTVAETKLFVFGMDGGTFQIADTLALPNLEALERDGSRAILHSEEPMLSPILWTTMASGVPPSVHAIQGFHTRSDQCRAARFWDVARDAGLRVGLYKWLVTWPPPDDTIPGFVVPAWLAPTPETQPSELSFVKEIELGRRLHRQKAPTRPLWQLALEGIPRGLRFGTLVQAGRVLLADRLFDPALETRARDLQLLRVTIDRDVFLWALHRYRPAVATFTTYATDALSHTHWQAMDEPGSPWGEAIPDAYRQADAVLGEIRSALSPDATIVVLSDHGFRPMDEALDGPSFAPRTEALQAYLSERVGPVEVARVGHKVTVVLGADGTHAGAVTEALEDLVQASTGAPLYRWEPLPTTPGFGLTLRNEHVDEAGLERDRVLGWTLGDFVSLTDPHSGEHDRDGMWVAAGPEVARGMTVAPLSLLDVAPTLLTLLGFPAAEDMPGQVRFGRELPRVPTYAHLVSGVVPAGSWVEADEEVLRALGYIH